jgi:heterotetrameric sarcosine oxidase gamma subunit
VIQSRRGLDLDPRRFPIDRSTRARFAKISSTLDRRDASSFELYVARSHLHYLSVVLEDAEKSS